jgi:hypothetical protein
MNIPNHLLPVSLRRAEHERGEYFHRPAPGVTLEQVLDPNYWENLAERLQLDDRIEVVAPDRSYDIDLRVVAIDPHRHWAAVQVRGGVERPAAPARIAGPAADAQGFVIDRDPVQGWRILNGRDLIAKDLPDEAAARKMLAGIRTGTPAKSAKAG